MKNGYKLSKPDLCRGLPHRPKKHREEKVYEQSHKTHAQYKSENPVTFTERFNAEGTGDGKPVKVYRKPGAVSVDRLGTGGRNALRTVKEIRRAAKKAIRMEKRHVVKAVKVEHDPKVNAKLERRWAAKGLHRAA